MRAAIYARFSSDRQSDRSIDDQIALCQRHLPEGTTVVDVFADYAISGAATLNRPGLGALMDAARAGRLDMVMAEAMDRLSRDQADIATIHKQLAFRGVRLVTVAEGAVDEMHIGLKGTMNALFLKDLAQKTRRGQRGRVDAGHIAGGKCYGYRVVRRMDDAGKVDAGLREIDAGEADIVRRIFAEYAAGLSPRAIAAALNREGVPGPRGKGWGASTISGSRKRGTGILNNPLYAGRIVWNKQRYVKDPDTGRRQALPNESGDHVTVEAPDLRIVEPDIWDAVRARRDAEGRTHQHPPRQRPKYLFSGLVRCGSCGGTVTMVTPGRMGCSSARQKGTCDMRQSIKVGELERRVLAAIRDNMLPADLAGEYMREYHAELKRLANEYRRGARARERERQELERKRARLVEAVGSGNMEAADVAGPLADVKARLAQLDAAPPAPSVVEYHPNAADNFRRHVADLQAALKGTDELARAEAAQIIRGLVDAIEVHPTNDRFRVDLMLVGELARILALTQPKLDQGLRMAPVVAGAGFEPATFRL